MLFTTASQFVALAVALVAGWLFGLASHPGGRKWKQRYTEERAANAAVRKEHEARIAELERDNARLAAAAPAPAPIAEPVRTAGDVGTPADRPAAARGDVRGAATSATPAYPEEPTRR